MTSNQAFFCRCALAFSIGIVVGFAFSPLWAALLVGLVINYGYGVLITSEYQRGQKDMYDKVMDILEPYRER